MRRASLTVLFALFVLLLSVTRAFSYVPIPLDVVLLDAYGCPSYSFYSGDYIYDYLEVQPVTGVLCGYDNLFVSYYYTRQTYYYALIFSLQGDGNYYLVGYQYNPGADDDVSDIQTYCASNEGWVLLRDEPTGGGSGAGGGGGTGLGWLQGLDLDDNSCFGFDVGCDAVGGWDDRLSYLVSVHVNKGVVRGDWWIYPIESELDMVNDDFCDVIEDLFGWRSVAYCECVRRLRGGWMGALYIVASLGGEYKLLGIWDTFLHTFVCKVDFNSYIDAVLRVREGGGLIDDFGLGLTYSSGSSGSGGESGGSGSGGESGGSLFSWFRRTFGFDPEEYKSFFLDLRKAYSDLKNAFESLMSYNFGCSNESDVFVYSREVSGGVSVAYDDACGCVRLSGDAVSFLDEVAEGQLPIFRWGREVWYLNLCNTYLLAVRFLVRSTIAVYLCVLVLTHIFKQEAGVDE